MSWLQIRIRTSINEAESLEDALLAAGAASVTMEDNANQPILEPGVGQTPLWDDIKVTGLFAAETDTTEATIIAMAHHGKSFTNFRWEILEDKDWEREWMDNYQPMQFGRRLWICPSWKTPPQPDAINLLLDPGLAFGTGTHPTTALCLEWLDSTDLNGQTVIDYGCGSGILGIAALLLGAKEVIAIDNDPQALLATIDNAVRNGLDSSRIQAYLPEDAPIGVSADTVIANILAGPLEELGEKLAKLTKTGGNIVLSGLLDIQAEPLRQHYQQWFTMPPANNRDEWMRLAGTKNA